MNLKPAVKISHQTFLGGRKIEHFSSSCPLVCATKFSNVFALFSFLSFSPKQPVTREGREGGTMESAPLEQSATVDELLEACIQAFGWSSLNIYNSIQLRCIELKFTGNMQIWCCRSFSGDPSSYNLPVLCV